MRRALLSLSAAASIALASPPARAYRPFDGTDADVAELGEFELEMGPTHFYRESDRNYLIAPATVLNFGIFDRTELVIDFQDYVALNPEVGAPRAQLLDTDVLLKHTFRAGTLQGQSGLSIAVEAGPLLPEINGSHGAGGSVDTILSYRWPAITLHFNEWGEITREHNPYVFSGVIVEGPHDWVVRPVAEIFASHEWNASDERSALVGAIWTVRESFAVDLGLRAAVIAPVDGPVDNAYEVRLGFTWALPMWGHAENAGSSSRPRRLMMRGP